MNKTLIFNRKHNNFPKLSFWKKLPTKSKVEWSDNESCNITKNIFSHVATDTVYFYDNNNCISQKFSYDSDSTLQDPQELFDFPVKIEFSDEPVKNYVLIPIQHFDQIVTDLKNSKVKLYEDYMDQGWRELTSENYKNLYVEKGDDTISYVNGEGVWILFEDMKRYDPNYEELFGMCLCEINENEDN